MTNSLKDEIASILIESGVSFKSNSRSFILNCPHCHKKDKLYIRHNDGRFVCFYCKEIDNFQGRPEFALAELTPLFINEIKSRLYKDQEISNDLYVKPFIVNDFIDSEEIELYSEFLLAEVRYTPDIVPLDRQASVAGVKYLESRGISLELAKAYNLMFNPSAARVVFPVEFQKKLYGWQSRTIKEGSIKILTSKGLKKDKTLMFRDRLASCSHCVLCEGPIDAIKAHFCGGNVATMGKAVSIDQINIVKNSGIKRLYLALDPDASAEGRRLIDMFSGTDIQLYDMRPKHHKDLGEMTLEEVRNLFDSAEPIERNKLFIYIKNHYE